MKKGAKFSDCGKHRLMLWRIWDDTKRIAMCIGLNPSTANTDTDDATIRRLCGSNGLLANNGFGGLYMLNLFTFITPYPKELTEKNVVSDEYYRHVLNDNCHTVIFCWGNFKEATERSNEVIKLFPDAYCFGKNENGTPKHPLYLKSDTIIQPFNQ